MSHTDSPEHLPLPAAPAAGGDAFDLAAEAMVLLRPDGSIVRANLRTASLLGIAPEAMLGEHWTRFAHVSDRDAVDGVLQAILRGERQRLLTPEYEFERPDGATAYYEAETTAAELADGEPGFLVRFVDLGAEHRARRAIEQVEARESNQRMLGDLHRAIGDGADPDVVEQAVMAAISEISGSPLVIITDRRGSGETFRVRAATGFGPGELPVVADTDQSELIAIAFRQGTTAVIDDWTASGIRITPAAQAHAVVAALAAPVIVHGRPVAVLTTYRTSAEPWSPHEIEVIEGIARIYADVLARWEADAERLRLDLHDRLTGLPTMTLLLDRIEQALERDRAAGQQTGLIVLDIDHFKFVNDAFGHDVGDRLLQAVVPRLQSVVTPGDTIARLSGDEFVVLAGERDDVTDVMTLAAALLDVFAEPFVADGDDHVLTASVGLALAGAHATPQQMLGDADAATFRAKELGRGRIEVFDPSLRARVTERVRTERELRGAADRGELSLRFQPIVDLRSGLIEGVETLVRWEHPERGLVGPGDFISVAEESGLIVGLGEWVLRTACEQAATWMRELPLPHPFRVSVNLSARQLGEPGIIATIVDALEQSGMPATSLALEVTESVLIEEEEAVGVLTDLRTRGIRIMLDDFGTGYSSLSYLRRFEVDALKIDRAFVSELGQRRQDALLVSALVQMAGALGIDAVAEGVETAQQAQMLRVLGCGLAQGFHFARPLTTEDATALLSAGGAIPGGKPR